MDPIRLGLIGCGGMGLRHVYGLRELRDHALRIYDLIAVCDSDVNNAEYVAAAASSLLGTSPRVYTDAIALLEEESTIEAVDIVTDTRSHHTIACHAFETGKHVIVEKPMGVTVRACRSMVARSLRCNRKLAVAHNYRRDPINRLVKALLDSKAIGDPFMVVQVSIQGGKRIQQGIAWKHIKLNGGYPIEMGVHYADLLMYFLGTVEEVYAQTAIFEKSRSRSPGRAGLSSFYEHRLGVEPDIVNPTSEDTLFSLLRFSSGALGQWTISAAGHGERNWSRLIFGSKGSINAPEDRSGKPIAVKLGNQAQMRGTDVLQLLPDYEPDDITRKLFSNNFAAYEMPFPEIDRKLIAVELYDFAESIVGDREPEVGGTEGLKATALAYALCESGYLKKPVLVQDVENDRINGYQDEINASLNLLSPETVGVEPAKE